MNMLDVKYIIFHGLGYMFDQFLAQKYIYSISFWQKKTEYLIGIGLLTGL